MKRWERIGELIHAEFEAREAAVIRGLAGEIHDMVRARAQETPQDELAELTGIRSGNPTIPDDPVLHRLLPDFHRLDADNVDAADRDSASALRSLHELELLDYKAETAAVMLKACPEHGGEITLSLDEASAWLAGLNDIRLSLGVILDLSDDTPEQFDDDHPHAAHLGVYHWLTMLQETLLYAITNQEDSLSE